MKNFSIILFLFLVSLSTSDISATDQTISNQQDIESLKDTNKHIASITIKDVKQFDESFIYKLHQFLKERQGVKDLLISECQFLPYEMFSFLNNIPIENLSIINCNLTDEHLDNILMNFDPYTAQTLDLSNNPKLGENKDEVERILKENFEDRFAIRSLTIKGNTNLQFLTNEHLPGIGEIIVDNQKKRPHEVLTEHPHNATPHEHSDRMDLDSSDTTEPTSSPSNSSPREEDYHEKASSFHSPSPKRKLITP